MGWKDAPVVEDEEKKPAWMSAPVVDDTEEQKPERGGATRNFGDANIFGLPDKVERAIFPTSGVQAVGKRNTGDAGLLQGIGQGFDALGLPIRALGTVAGHKITDPKSALLRSVMDKGHTYIDDSASKKPSNSATIRSMDAMDRKIAHFGTELIGNTLSDPLFLVSLAKNALAKPLKGVATKIESSILGKGNKALLKKQGLTSEQAARTALDENLGGSLKGTINKVNKRSDKIEDAINDLLEKTQKENPNLTVDVSAPVQRAGARIEAGDPEFYKMTKPALAEVDDWIEEMARFDQLGEKGVKEANDIKRLIGKKGYTKGQFGDPNLPAKEKVADLINLEMRDDIAAKVPGLQKHNDEYKKILPIKKLAQNRLPVGQSNDLLGLGTLLLAAGKLDLPQLAKIAGYQLTKSGNVAQGMYNTGKVLNKIPNTHKLSLGVNAITTLRKKDKKE